LNIFADQTRLLTLDFSREPSCPLTQQRTSITHDVLQRSIGAVQAFFFSAAAEVELIRPDQGSEPMARASKIRKAVIPEPSFVFFLRALGVMLLLVVVMTAYFTLRT
jgi:hypothetical protein